MLWSVLRHILWVALLLLVLSLLGFVILLRDPLNANLVTQNIYIGYFHYLGTLLQGDCFITLFLAFIFGLPLGIISAVNSEQVFAKSLQILSYVGLSIPIFWLAPILLYVAALSHWEIAAIGQYNLLYEIKSITGFPVIDMWFMEVPYRTKIVQNILQHLALPTLVLCILPTMEIIRIIHQRAEYILNQNFSKVATTRGWSKWKILHQYVFRNTFPLLVPQVPRVFTLVLTQCMLVETALGWPGIGRWLINAVNEQDYNSIAAGVIVIGVCIILIDTFTKIFTFILDPFKKKGWYAR